MVFPLKMGVAAGKSPGLVCSGIALDQAPHWREKEKKSASEASREVIWGGKRVAEPGDMPLMPPIPPPSAINLSLKCQHVKFTSRMSSWACYVALKNIWIRDEVKVQAKSSTKLRSSTGLTPTFFACILCMCPLIFGFSITVIVMLCHLNVGL